MNGTHFKCAQNLFLLKDTVEILSSPYSILLGINHKYYFRFPDDSVQNKMAFKLKVTKKFAMKSESKIANMSST